MIISRIHRRGEERLLAACDAELLGKTLAEGRIRMTVSEEFYNGETITEETLGERMGSVTIMNLVGDRSVNVAIEKGYVSPENVLIIAGVKHAQAVIL